MFTTILILHYILVTILLLGAYLTARKSPMRKTTRMFVSMYISFAMVFILDSIAIISNYENGGMTIYPLDLLYILTGVVSQLFMHWIFYNLLFSIERSTKIIVAMSIPAVVLSLLIWGLESSGVAPTCHDICSIDTLMANVASPAVYLRLALLVVQLAYSASILLVSRTIVPIYQSYIYKNEVNDTHNILWVREVANLYMLMLIVYIINALFFNNFTYILYFAVVIIPFARIIILKLEYNSIDIIDNLYDKLQIRWSFRKLCYIENQHELDSKIDTNSQLRLVFSRVDSWLNSEVAYTNTNFSFAEISKQFPDINYNIFNDALQVESRGNFQSYIRECRINYAIKLITNNEENLQIKEIAYRVGFESQSSFTRAFKATKGCTPSQWRICGDK